MLFSMYSIGNAGAPVWTFEPLTPTTISILPNGTATVQYRVTNQSNKPHTLMMQPIQGISQVTTGLGVCGNPFALAGKASCVLTLQINGSQINNSISNEPLVCQIGSTNQCYRPAKANVLNITKIIITVSGSPLALIPNGATGTLTVNNVSQDVTATNITSNFSGTALNGNVTETGNTCVSLAPGSSCTLTYTPGTNLVSQTAFTIQGDNANAVTAAIGIYIATLTSGTTNAGTASIVLVGTGLDAIWSALVPIFSVTVDNQTSCDEEATYLLSQFNINTIWTQTGQTNTGWAPTGNEPTTFSYQKCVRLCTNFDYMPPVFCTNLVLVS